jgi:hypothetical protein
MTRTISEYGFSNTQVVTIAVRKFMKAKYFLVLCLALIGNNSFGHEQAVHQAITTHVVDFMFSDPACAEFLSVIAADMASDAAKRRMVEGSWNEDFASKEDSVGGNRSLNHFYDPISGLGLSDLPALGGAHSPLGRNSFMWASISNCAGVNVFLNIINNKDTKNIWSWQNARGYQWLGLTETIQLVRQTNLDNMFRAAGQVMHLLEDTSQPQHVRNEQHLDNNNQQTKD